MPLQNSALPECVRTYYKFFRLKKSKTSYSIAANFNNSSKAKVFQSLLNYIHNYLCE